MTESGREDITSGQNVAALSKGMKTTLWASGQKKCKWLSVLYLMEMY